MNGQDNGSKPEKNLSPAFARHQIIRDKNDKPVDFLFLKVNSSFEKTSGLSIKEILGKKASVILRRIKKDTLDLNTVYKQMASGDTCHSFECYSEPFKRWYKIATCSGDPDFSNLFILDITDQKINEYTTSAVEAERKALLDAIPDLMFLFNKEGRFLDYKANNRGAALV